MRNGVGGRVQLDCTVQGNLGVACTIASETPANMGFGRAALGAVDAYRAQPNLSDGSSAVGANARLVTNFQPPAE
jgi:protein TonB